MLNHCRILIAEDEAVIAYELAQAVEQAGGEVVGPVASVKEGLLLLLHQPVHAAILDVRLLDRDIAPIAAALLEQGKKVVFHTASPVPFEIIERFGVPVVCQKPMLSEHVVTRLALLIGHDDPQSSRPTAAEGCRPPPRRDTLAKSESTGFSRPRLHGLLPATLPDLGDDNAWWSSLARRPLP